MREVSYKTHWAYAGKGIKRKALLVEFVLDILYLMNTSGVIPPFHVLNEVLRQGGSSGGMGPGTSWRPFSIKDAEYQELVETLLKLDVAEAKKTHPYVYFERVIRDESLETSASYIDWLQGVSRKYPYPT